MKEGERFEFFELEDWQEANKKANKNGFRGFVHHVEILPIYRIYGEWVRNNAETPQCKKIV